MKPQTHNFQRPRTPRTHGPRQTNQCKNEQKNFKKEINFSSSFSSCSEIPMRENITILFWYFFLEFDKFLRYCMHGTRFNKNSTFIIIIIATLSWNDFYISRENWKEVTTNLQDFYLNWKVNENLTLDFLDKFIFDVF